MQRDNKQEDIGSLLEIKKAWNKKLNDLRLSEPSISDVSSLHSLRNSIDEAKSKIQEIENEIELLQKENNNVIVENLDGIELEINQAIEIFKIEKKELDFKSSKEDIAKLHSLRSKIYDEIFKDLDERIDFALGKRELLYSSTLFDTIYTSQLLNGATISEIQRIRGNHDTYKWYDRSILVSALTLSLIHFKFDEKKANILLDFVTDFESQVWERALTGLTIALLYQKNRGWMRSLAFVNRLKTLQNNELIQDSMKTLEFIFRNELYKLNLFNPNFYAMDLFKNPMNCFVPFYENNEVYLNAIDNAKNDFDTNDFDTYLKEMPFMDSYKYALCIGLSENQIKKEKVNKRDQYELNLSLSISDDFKPFQNIVSEFYCFYNFFPEKKVEDVFKSQFSITNTNLKNIVLKKTMQLFLEANKLYNDGEYTDAISKYNDILRIDDNISEVHWQLSNCYYDAEEYQEALHIFLKLESDQKHYYSNIRYHIADCYNELSKFKESNEYLKKSNSDLNFDELILMTGNFEELDMRIDALLYCEKAENKANESSKLLSVARMYSQLGKPQKAFELVEKIKSKPDTVFYWQTLGLIYFYAKEIENAIPPLEKAYKMEKDNLNTQLTFGRALLFAKTNLTLAKKLFSNLIKSKGREGIAHGNLGHLYLLEGDMGNAIKEYAKCLIFLKDKSDFKKKMKFDEPFMNIAGINSNEFEKITNDICISN